MTKAKQQTRFGVIRADGSWVIEPKFAHAGVYNDERLPVSDDGKSWGFASAGGETVIAPRFTFAFNFLSGAASVESAPNVWDVVDREGNPLALWRGTTRDGRIRCSTGRSIRNPGVTFEPNLAPDTKWGLLDEQGAIVVEPAYYSIGDLMEGLACAWTFEGSTVYLDRDGKIAAGPLPGLGRGFANGWARVQVPGQPWSFVDRSGATVLETPYTSMEPFREDRALFQSSDKLYGIVDRAGAVLVPPRYPKARSFANGMAAVATISDPANWRTERWGFVDASGAEVIAPAFVRVTEFSGGVAAASVYPEGKSFTLWGLIDRAGAWIVEPQYAEIQQLADGVAKFVHSAPTTSGRGKEGLLDATGTILADGYTFVDWGRGFPAAVNKGGRQATDGTIKGGTWGFIDATGAEVVPCQFASLGSTFGAGFGHATVGVAEVVVAKVPRKKVVALESVAPEAPGAEASDAAVTAEEPVAEMSDAESVAPEASVAEASDAAIVCEAPAEMSDAEPVAPEAVAPEAVAEMTDESVAEISDAEPVAPDTIAQTTDTEVVAPEEHVADIGRGTNRP